MGADGSIVAGTLPAGFVTELRSKPICQGYKNGMAITVRVSQFQAQHALSGDIDGCDGRDGGHRGPRPARPPGGLGAGQSHAWRACRCSARSRASLTAVRWLVVGAEPITSVDVTSADTLDEFDETPHAAGNELCLARAEPFTLGAGAAWIWTNQGRR